MRMFISALFSAAVALPTLVYATSLLPDPTDATAPVPAASVPSVFADYQPYQDEPPGSWKELNKAVLNARGMSGMTGMTGMAGMNHSQMPAGSAAARTRGGK